MFGLSLGHIILFGVILLIFVGPEQLPEVARTIARVLNELKRATADFQNQFTSHIDLDLNKHIDLKKPWETSMKLPPAANTIAREPEGPVPEPVLPPSGGHTEPDDVTFQVEESAAPVLPVGNHPVSDDESKKS